MKIVVFDVEHREAHAFKLLETKNEILLVAESLREANASTFSSNVRANRCIA